MKETRGASTEMLARFTQALSTKLKDRPAASSKYLFIHSRPAGNREAVEVRTPLRTPAKELERQLPLAVLYPDLPRGRKRPGWKRELERSLKAASEDLAGAGQAKIDAVIRGYRAEKKQTSEITIK